MFKNRKFLLYSSSLGLVAATYGMRLLAVDQAEIANNLTLVGVISADSDGTQAKAGVAVLKDKRNQRSLLTRTGERLPFAGDWLVKSINRRRVVVISGEQELELVHMAAEDKDPVSVAGDGQGLLVRAEEPPVSASTTEKFNRDLDVKTYDYRTPYGDDDDDRDDGEGLVAGEVEEVVIRKDIDFEDGFAGNATGDQQNSDNANSEPRPKASEKRVFGPKKNIITH